MLDDLANHLTPSKAQDLISRLEAKQIEQALPAEIELGVTWSLSKLGEIEIEPEWYSENRAPDVFSEALFEGHEAIVEVAGLSDAALPADRGMRNASRKLSQEANIIERGAGKFLSFFFFEKTKTINGEYIRRVCVPEKLAITDQLRADLASWLLDHQRRSADSLNLRDGRLNVLIEWNEMPQTQFNFRTSMPPEIRSDKKNYVLGVLEKKDKQLRSPLFIGLKCVVLGDVGSTALHQSQDRDYTGRGVISGGKIASKFISDRRNEIDVIIILSARRRRRSLRDLSETIEWEAEVHSKQEISLDGVRKFIAQLPPPRLEGYQIRQLHEQKVFSPKGRGFYLGTSVTWRKGIDTEISFSSRAFLDLLAGRETKERFLRRLSSTAGGGHNLFTHHLEQGRSISGIRIEPGGLDADDDQIVVRFDDDPGAGSLKKPAGGDDREEQPNSK